MNKLKSIWVNTSIAQDKVALYMEEIKEIIKQIRQWEDIKTCRCSYYPLRWLVEMAINWEIGEKYRWIKYFDNEGLIKKLACMINNKSI